MKKLILTAIVACGITCSTLSFANLTLVNETDNDINVACGSLGIGFPIGAHNQRSLDWNFLSSLFGSSFKCTFTGKTMSGVAYANVSGNSKTGALYDITASGVHLDYNGYNPNSTNYATDITVNINP